MSNLDPFSEIYPELLENGAAEVGDLIGQALELQDAACNHGILKDVFSVPKQKFGLVAFDAKVAPNDSVYLLFDLNLAVELAGRLIMLPADEIIIHKKKKELDGELFDAFSEIANILGGVINTAFQNSFAEKKIHIIKGKVELFAPKSTGLPLPEGPLTTFSGNMSIKGEALGFLQFFFPHALLMELPSETPSDAVAVASEPGAKGVAEEPAIPSVAFEPTMVPDIVNGKGGSSQKIVLEDEQEQKIDFVPIPDQKQISSRSIAIVGDDEKALATFEESVRADNVEIIRLTLESDFKKHLSVKNTCCVFLLLDDVNDQGLASAIKVKAAMKNEAPLILGGPQWTRTMVLKARRYGASDILVTPASPDLILLKCRKYL